jgi:di/tricarboxylate transporter
MSGDIIQDAKSEISGMAKEGMHHPSTKPVLTGAAAGALAGFLLPVLSIPVGLVLGAGAVFYKRLRP